MRNAAVTVLITFLTISSAYAAEESISIVGLSVSVWTPEALTTGVRHPVIIFSHGFRGCATQSRFLMKAFAAEGYVVFAPNHEDAGCRNLSAWFGSSDVSFRQPERWDETTFRNRADDIRRLIDALHTDQRFGPIVDWSHLGLAGHSLGGYTVLGLAGAWSGWTLPGIKAVLALSPYTRPFTVHHTLGRVAVPVMYQGGTRDFGVTPTLHKSEGAYDQTRSPKYYVEFDGAGHMAWTNIGRAAHESITAYSTAFLNHYVLGQPAVPLLTRAAADVDRLRYQSEFGTRNDVGSARTH